MEIQPLRIMVGGKTGVGKSSVLNAILGKDMFRTGITPETRQKQEAPWESGSDLLLVDMPGFGEAKREDSLEKVQEYAKGQGDTLFLETHVGLLILKADDRALELEQNAIKKWQKRDMVNRMPFFIVVNQIDKMKPTREWSPEQLNLKNPETEKEKNIRAYLNYVASVEGFALFANERILPVCAGESAFDTHQYGIVQLRDAILGALPEALKVLFYRVASETAQQKRMEAQRIVKRHATLSAGAVLANFVPMSDALVLAPIQIAMILHLGKLYGMELTMSMASALLTNLGLTFVGRFTAQTLISFVPGVKHFVGPPLAFGLTYTMGLVVADLFSQGKLSATEKEYKALVLRYEQEGKKNASQYKKEQ